MAWWLRPRTPDPEVGVRVPLGSDRIVSLRKTNLLSKNTGNTKEGVAPPQHDCKIVYSRIKSTNQLDMHLKIF